jgi:hypothetical protein
MSDEIARNEKMLAEANLRTRHLNVRISPNDMLDLQDMIRTLQDKTNLRVTKGDMISYLIKTAKERGWA